MTYIDKELNNICSNWCPMIDMCADDHECGMRIKIRHLIWEIAGKNDDEDE